MEQATINPKRKEVTMSNLKIGGSLITGAFLGNDKVQKIYMGNKLVYRHGYDAYNIVVREGYNIVLYDINGNKLNEVADNQTLRMTTDNSYVYALCGLNVAYQIRLYDFQLNEVDRILLPGMGNPNNYTNDLITAANKRVMFHSINTGGVSGCRMGFIDLNKSKDVHYVDVSQPGSACLRFEFFYDENTDSFYSKDGGGKVLKLNEETYEWEDTGFTNFISANPCAHTTWKMSFINGLGNAICSGEELTPTGNLSYLYNNREGIVFYKDEEGIPLWYYVMLDKETPFSCCITNNYVRIGTITDLMNPIVVTKKLPIPKTTGVLLPMYKHPYKNIILIPVGISDYTSICIYDYDTDICSLINCMYKCKNLFACNAVTVPKY